MYKFNTIFESNFQRFQGGGFLTGDLVKIIDGAMSNEWVSSKGENVKEQIRRFMESEYKFRISTVKPVRPAVQGSIQQDQVPGSYFCDIALEKAPGMFLDFMEVPSEILETIDTGINLSPVSDANKRKDKIKQISPLVLLCEFERFLTLWSLPTYKITFVFFSLNHLCKSPFTLSLKKDAVLITGFPIISIFSGLIILYLSNSLDV